MFHQFESYNVEKFLNITLNPRTRGNEGEALAPVGARYHVERDARSDAAFTAERLFRSIRIKLRILSVTVFFSSKINPKTERVRI
jgi:hypothetical protein